MAEIVVGPLTDEEPEWTEDAVFELCYFRITATDEEWETDPARQYWDISLEEAATRLADEDYSAPDEG